MEGKKIGEYHVEEDGCYERVCLFAGDTTAKFRYDYGEEGGGGGGGSFEIPIADLLRMVAPLSDHDSRVKRLVEAARRVVDCKQLGFLIEEVASLRTALQAMEVEGS